MPRDKDFSLLVCLSIPCCLSSMPCYVMCPKKLHTLSLSQAVTNYGMVQSYVPLSCPVSRHLSLEAAWVIPCHP